MDNYRFGISAYTKYDLREFLTGSGSDLVNVLTCNDEPIAILLPGTGETIAHADIAATLNNRLRHSGRMRHA